MFLLYQEPGPAHKPRSTSAAAGNGSKAGGAASTQSVAVGGATCGHVERPLFTKKTKVNREA